MNTYYTTEFGQKETAEIYLLHLANKKNTKYDSVNYQSNDRVV